jgi:hypothetical protein
LRGADLVFLAMHRPYAGMKVSHNTLLVVQCDRPVELTRLRRAFGRLAEFCPWPASRLRRGLPWGGLHWAAGPRTGLEVPPMRQVMVSSAGALHDELEAELNAVIDPRRQPPLRVLSIDAGPECREGRGFLVLTWVHPLMDPRGGQTMLRHLAHLDSEGDGPLPRPVPPTFAAASDRRSLRERARLGRRTLDYMRTLTRVPSVSPGTGLATFGRARFWQGAFVPRDASTGDTRATRDICWRLALVGKALSALWDKRGLPDVPFLVPISVDLRPKGEDGATIGNWLAFHFARFTPSETADLAGLARSLRAQMADAVRDGQIDANAVGMEFLRYRPLWMMPRSLPGGLGGDGFSFNFADVGDSRPALSTVFGRRVVNAYHAPAVLPRPGVGVFFNRSVGRSNLVISWVEGTMSEDEVAQIAEVVREGMDWVEAP